MAASSVSSGDPAHADRLADQPADGVVVRGSVSGVHRCCLPAIGWFPLVPRRVVSRTPSPPRNRVDEATQVAPTDPGGSRSAVVLSNLGCTGE
jgi:hypothetical protein